MHVTSHTSAVARFEEWRWVNYSYPFDFSWNFKPKLFFYYVIPFVLWLIQYYIYRIRRQATLVQSFRLCCIFGLKRIQGLRWSEETLCTVNWFTMCGSQFLSTCSTQHNHIHPQCSNKWGRWLGYLDLQWLLKTYLIIHATFANICDILIMPRCDVLLAG